jgi:hypothetical protein
MRNRGSVPEYWVEENIRPTNPDQADSVLVQRIKPLIDDLKEQGIITWHFLREDSGWRGREKIPHIRLRVRARDKSQQLSLKCFLATKLDELQKLGEVLEHYWGNHGRPNEEYQGEPDNFDEEALSPEGWNITQRYFQACSEIAPLVIEAQLRNTHLGPRFNLCELVHFLPNPCGRREGFRRLGGQNERIIYLLDMDLPEDLRRQLGIVGMRS